MASASYLAPTSTWLFGLPGVGSGDDASRGRRRGKGGRKSRASPSPDISMASSVSGNSVIGAGSFDMSWVLAGTMPAALLSNDDDPAVQIVKAAQREKVRAGRPAAAPIAHARVAEETPESTARVSTAQPAAAGRHQALSLLALTLLGRQDRRQGGRAQSPVRRGSALAVCAYQWIQL